MNHPTKHRLPSETAVAAVAGLSSARLLRLLTGWRAGLREFAVILLSVITALAAQAWWQSREDRERELDYLRQLLADTRENARQLDETIGTDSAANVASRQLLGVMIAGAPAPPADTVWAWVGRAGTSANFRPRAGTYRALVGSGDLRLLRTDTLRAVLTAYAAQLDAEEARQRDIRLTIYEQVGAFARAFPFLRTSFLGAHVAIPPETARRVLHDQDAATILFVWQAATVNSINGLEALRGSTAHLLRLLQAERGIVAQAEGPAPEGRRRGQP